MLESGLGNTLSLDVVFDDAEGAAKLLAAFPKHLAPLTHGAVSRDRVVVAFPHCRVGVVLDVAALYTVVKTTARKTGTIASAYVCCVRG